MLDPTVALNEANNALRDYHTLDCDPQARLGHAASLFRCALEHASHTPLIISALIGLSHTFTYLADVDGTNCVEHAQDGVTTAERAHTLFESLNSDDSDTLAHIHNTRGCALLRRYVYLGDENDILEAIKAQKMSLDYTDSNTLPSSRAARLYHFAFARYTMAQGSLKPRKWDLDDALDAISDANELVTPRKALYIITNGDLLVYRARSITRDLRLNLSTSLNASAESFQTTAPDAYLAEPNNLFSQFGPVSYRDLVDNITKAYKFATRLAENSSVRMVAQLGYINAWFLRVKSANDTEDFNRCAELILESVLNKPPTTDLRHLSYLNEIFAELVRCQRDLGLHANGMIERISLIIEGIFPQSHIQRPAFHYFLAESRVNEQLNLLQSGSRIINLLPAIEQYRAALRHTPDWHPSQGLILLSLVYSLSHSVFLGDMAIEEGKVIFQEAACWIGVLAVIQQALGFPAGLFKDLYYMVEQSAIRSFKSVDCADIDVLKLHRHILAIRGVRSMNSPNALSIIATHAQAVLRLAKIRGTRANSGECIEEAVQMWQHLDTHRAHVNMLDSAIDFGLGAALYLRAFHEKYENNDTSKAYQFVNEGISYMERSLLPELPTSIDAIENIVTLANAHVLRHRLKTYLHLDSNDLDAAMTVLRNAKDGAVSLKMPPSCLYILSGVWLTRSLEFKHESTLEAYNTRVNSMIHRVWVGLNIRARYEKVEDTKSTLATDAAVYACAHGNLALAIEFLEKGRSILFAQTLPLRSQYIDLRASEPTLVAELERVGQEISRRSFDHYTEQPDQGAALNHLGDQLNEDNCKLRALGETWDQLVSEVRNLPGYQDFLQTPSLAKLCQAACDGPVVFIITSEQHSACYAIIILAPNPDSIRLIDLPLTPDTTTRLAEGFSKALSRNINRMRSENHDETRGFIKPTSTLEGPETAAYKILTELWKLVMGPVVDFVKQNISNQVRLICFAQMSL